VCISFAVMKMHCPASMSINGTGWYEVRSSSLSTCLSALASFTLFKTYWFVGTSLFTKSSVMCFHKESWPTQVLHYLMSWNAKLSVLCPSSLQACITSKIPKIWNRRIYCPLYQVYSNVAKSLLLTTDLHLTLFLSSLGFLKHILSLP